MLHTRPARRVFLAYVGITLLSLLSPLTSAGESLTSRSIGQVVAVRGQEALRRAGGQQLIKLTAGQSLTADDEVRTGPYGAAAILLDDDTQVRVHRNSVFQIQAVRGADGVEESRFALLSGAAWSRAKPLFRTATRVEPGQRTHVSVRTPAATLGVGGADWHVSVDAAGRTTATVLAGAVELANELGSVALSRGEVGSAERGHVPFKRAEVGLRDRPLIGLPSGPEWLEMLSVSGGARHGDLARDVPVDPAADDDARIAAAEIAVDSGDYPRAKTLLNDSSNTPRSALVAGLIALHARDYALAEQHLALAASHSEPRRAILARLASIGVLVGQQRFDAADTAMAELLTPGDEVPDTHLLRSWLLSYAGDHTAAITVADAAATRFANDPRFPILLAHLYFLTDQSAPMLAAVDRALILDPRAPWAWYQQGLYYQYGEPDAPRALAAFSSSVALRPSLARGWMQRGQVNYDLGDYRAALSDLRAALASDPGSATVHANYGLVLAYLGRRTEAQSQFEQARALDPSEPSAELGLAYLDLLAGEPRAGVEKALKALVANPELPGVNSVLAAANYQSRAYGLTQQALDSALQHDPDDPVPDLIGAVTAVDNFEAGVALRHARAGFEKTLRAKSYKADTLANADDGRATFGNAYSNLGLDDWGGYYSQLAFDPYSADGYFYLSRANQFASERARRGANLQGLLLDPTAVSAPTRYYEPFRQARHDVILESSVGTNDSALIYSGGGSVQGLWHGPNPIAYFVSGSHQHDDGKRDNDSAGHQVLRMQLGSSFDDQSHNVLFDLSAQRTHEQMPGAIFDNDPDDNQTNAQVFADLGYQFRINQHNRIMARVAGGYLEQRFINGSPFGRGLPRIEYSLLNAFGPAAADFFKRFGLHDITSLVRGNGAFSDFSTVLVSGGDAHLLCRNSNVERCPVDEFTFGPQKDDDRTVSETVDVNARLFQLRHLLNVGPVELTYGAEYARFNWHFVNTAVIPQESGGLAELFVVDLERRGCPFPCVFDPIDIRIFPLADPAQKRFSQNRSADTIEAYVQARLKINSSLWLEAGAFYRNVDLGEEEQQQVDPRVGLAWRLTSQHWLRISSQSALLDNLGSRGTLAPVATVGTVIPDTFPFAGGSLAKTWYHQLRWDAEWSPRLYTFVQLDRQDIEDFTVDLAPWSRFPLLGIYPDGRLDTVGFGTNVWLGERLGLSASYKYLWREERSYEDFQEVLPLVPEQEFHSGLVWVHPRAVTLGLTGDYIGQREAGLLFSDPLGGYWTAGAYANWQPFARHLSLTLALDNLLDTDYESTAHFPEAGRRVLFSVEYRF